MANTWQLISYSGLNPTGTISLQVGATANFTYTPVGANPEQEYVTEQGDLQIQSAGTSTLTFGRWMGSINQMFQLARNYAAGEGGQRVYLMAQPYGYPDTWRSEIVDGVIQPPKTALNYNPWEQSNPKKMTMPVTFTRRNYFEGTLTELPLTNTNGTNCTGGTLNIYNNGCGTGAAGVKQVNFVDVQGTAITGELPGRAVVSLYQTNSYNAFYIGESIWANPPLYNDQLSLGRPNNIEYYKFGAADGTLYADAYSSQGSAVHLTLPYQPVIGRGTAQFYILPPNYNMELGGWYTLMGRISGNGVYKFTFYDYYNFGGSVVPSNVSETILTLNRGTAPAGLTAFGLFPLTTFKLPFTQSAGTAIELAINIQAERISGTASLDADYVQVFGADRFKILEPYIIDQQASWLYVNDIDEEAYTATGSGGGTIYQPVTGYGGRLELFPGRKHRFYFAFSKPDGGEANALAQTQVRMFYRPRRLTL